MARRTRSFLFDNISKRLVQNTNKTAKEINTRVSANTTANTDILTKAEVQTVVSNTGINTLSDISIANVANEQVLQYNANTGKWENETLSLVSSVDGLTDTNLTSLSNGDYLVYSSAGSEWINRSLDLSSYVTDTEIADYSNTAQMNTAIAASNTAMKSYVDSEVANVDFSAYSTTTQMNTAIASSNTAMKNYVDAEVAGIVNSAPAALDTLNELAAALGDDANFSTTTSTALGNRLRIDVSNQSLTSTQQTNALTNLGITSTVTELNYTDGVTSNIQTQLNAKASTTQLNAKANLSGATFTGDVTISDGTNDFNVASHDGTNGLKLAGILVTATAAELNYVDGVTSNIQTQLNAKGTSNFSGAYADLTGKPSLFSGAYADLSGKPTIPTNTNQLTNGAGYITGITSSMVTTALGYTPGTSSFSGSYNDLSNKPTIPTNNNQLTNGAGYITSSSLSGYVARNFENTSRNLVIPTSSTSGSAGLAMETSGGTFMFQIYGTGTTYGFLDAQWGGWDIKKTAGGQMTLRVSGTDYTVYHTGNLPTIPTNNNQLTNGAGYLTSSNGVTTTYNSSLNSDSRNSRGVTRLYRRDSNSDYSVQTYWTGSYWRLYGYAGDSNHADTHVGYADSAGNADTVDGYHASSLVGTHNGHNRNIDAEVGALHFYADGGNSGRASTSYPYAMFQESGAWSTPYPDLRINYHTGITLSANPSYEGIRFKTDYNSSTVVLQVNGGSNYTYKTTWLNTDANSGMYSSTNGAHIWPNPGSYGSWKITGARNGWAGIEFGDQSGSTTTTLMMNNDTYGFHKNGTGWRFYNLSGSGHWPGNVVAYWSDQRLKENIVQLPSGKGLDIVLQLKPSSFNWKEDAKKVTQGCVDPSISEVSLIAQEAQAVNSQFVNINKTVAKGIVDGEEITDILTINYDKITPYLVQAIKDLNEKVEKLQGIIDGLTS